MEILSNCHDVVTMFTVIDDLNALLQLNKQITGRKPKLNFSEAATIALIKSEYGIRTWKQLYKLLGDKFTSEFNLPCYKNFVVLMNQYSQTMLVMLEILLTINKQQAGVVKLVDATDIPVCRNYNIKKHQTMKAYATRSKSSKGWFYGLKLHVVTDLSGQLLLVKFTTGNTGERLVLDEFLDKLSNSLIVADAGYISNHLQDKALVNSNILITGTRTNMKRLASFLDICLLNLRSRIEVVFSILKERLGLVTSLPRSVAGYQAHYIYILFGYLAKKAIS